MNPAQLADIVLMYIFLLIIITLHEFGHAWMATKMGDPTPRSQGRVTLNPIAHMDPIGTVLLPFLALFLSASGSPAARFIIGWGKPVQVEPAFFRNRKLGDTLVSLAGPFMNLVLALAALLLSQILLKLDAKPLSEAMVTLAVLSVFLAFFNLLPIPPLDGSHVLKHAIGMREETYVMLSQWGFVLVLVAINLPPVMWLLRSLTGTTLHMLAILVSWI